MTQEFEAEEARAAPARPRRRGRLLAGVAALGVLGLALVWQARAPIADRFIRDTLEEKGVPARYEIRQIGPRTQRLENVVIGDPARPDLTARAVEIDLGIAGFAPVVRAIRVEGLTVRASLRGGTLSLGAVDKLRGEGQGEGGLPAIDLKLTDGRVLLASDLGDAEARIDGAGMLSSGFRGRAVLASPGLRFGGCSIALPRAAVALAAVAGRLEARGPVALRDLACPDARVAGRAGLMNVDASLDPRDRAWRLDGKGTVEGLGGSELSIPSASVTIAAQRAEGDPPAGRLSLTAPRLVGPDLSGRSLRLGVASDDGRTARFDLAIADAASPLIGGVLARRAALASTPLAPVTEQLAAAVARLQRANRLSAQGEWTGDRLVVRQAALNGASGGFVALAAGGRLSLGGPQGWALDGSVISGGGGLPEARLRANKRADGGISARLSLADYRAGSARLASTPLLIERSPAGALSIRSSIVVDGPLPDGAVEALALPLDLRIAPGGKATVATACPPVSWRSLRLGALSLDPARLALCDPLGRPSLGRTMLAGDLGGSPLLLAFAGARHDLASGHFSLSALDATIGESAAPVRLAAASLEGRLGGGAIAGRLSGGSARIGTVPLDLGAIAGDWHYADGRLALNGAMRVADTAPERRFNPLDVPDARLSLADGRIEAGGTLTLAPRTARVARVAIRHDLGLGGGEARLDVDGLRFGDALQPDDLTPLSLGVVANVVGAVAGEGLIRWNRDGVTSSGTFETKDASLAAAFGPVSGLSARIRFTDLLGLVTAPDQSVTLGSVNPGIEVREGVVRYALLPNRQARIDGGRWPFAGGTLELLPTTLDLDARKARRMAFRVTGLEAGAFINELALEDISATGTYDGLLPMVFDESGGRIEGGILVARQQGLPPLVVRDAASLTAPCDPARQAGNLAYVGQVSNAQLGTMGRLAFDALKNLRYKCLTILLDGALDGEFVTRVAINGVNQGSPEASKSMITRAFLGLPFIFNVRIEAPFRGLINTARSFSDPSALIRESLGPQYQTVLKAPAPPSGLAVQPPESDKGAEGTRR